MANIRKSFNFRNGVQVDNDNFVVNPNGLVGIGTTIPSEIFDVRGTASVTGLVTATDVVSRGLNVTGVATATTISDGVIQITSGIITAASPTGVVTFHGDGAGLINIPTSQWVDIDVGLGFTSIYAAGNVGVGTQDPRFSFQIGGNPDTAGHEGVGIDSTTGDIISTGIVTATTFSGELAAPFLTGTIDDARLPATITSNITGNLTGNVTGNVTGNLIGNITGGTNVTGVLTATDLHADQLEVGLGTFTTVTGTGRVAAGTGGTGFAAIEGGFVGIGTDAPDAELQIRKQSGTLAEIVSDSGESKLSIGQQLGAGTSTAVLRFGNQDNTFDIINNDPGDIRMVLDALPAGINTGNFTWHHQSTGTSLMTLTYQGSLGVNNTSPSEKVSVGGGITATEKSYFGNGLEVTGTVTADLFDGTVTLPSVIENSNINSTLGVSTFATLNIVDVGPVGLGSIGINTETPICALDVRGDGVGGVGLFSHIGINTDVLGGVSFPAASDVSLGQILLDVQGMGRFGNIGIGTTALVFGSTNESIQVVDTGIGMYNGSLNIHGEDGAMGIGTYSPRASVDLSLAAAVGSDSPSLILPHLTNAQRTANVDRVSGGSTVAGSIIYNTDTNQFQGYNGTSWVNLA